MGFWGAVGNIFTGGQADSSGTLGFGSILGRGEDVGGGGNSNAGLTAMANASKEVAIAQSNAQVSIAQTQAATMQLGILKSSQDAQFQTLAWLTERLDANDVKMQIAVENAKLQFQEQSDRHVERMEQLNLDARELDIRAAESEKAGGISAESFLA